MAWMRTGESLAKLPELLLRGMLSFRFDRVPLGPVRLTPARRDNLLKTGVDMAFRRDRMLALPAILQIEPTNACGLKCPLCPTGAGALKRPRGFMSSATFRRILDELGDTMLLAVLYGWGESFLHPEMPAMIAECTKRGILTFTSTNGQCLQTREEAESVVRAGLTALVIAVDGSTQAIYDAYRKAGSLEKVKNCISLVEEAKGRLGSALPYTNLRAVLTRDNEADVEELQGLARRLGVDMVSFKTLGCLVGSPAYRTRETTDGATRRPGAGPSRRLRVRCPYPFRQPAVFWDGTVVGCEHDYDAELPWGRIGDAPFRDLWNGAAARATRRAVRRGGAAFCRNCPYGNLPRGGTVIQAEELRPPAVRAGVGAA